MSRLSRCDVNESQPGDAGDQQLPRSQDEAASASNGVGRTHEVPCTTTDAPTVVDSLAIDHIGVQHLETPSGQSASDLDLQVMKLKAERAEMKREKTRLSAQIRNAERNKRRLCNRATKLCNHDLLDVYAMRVHAQHAKNPQNTPAEG